MNGIPAVPVHTGGKPRRGKDGTFQLRSNRGQAGMPDFVAALPPFGTLLLGEVKTGGAVRKKHQRELHAKFEKVGAIAAVIHNLNDLEEVVKGYISLKARIG